MEKRGFLSTLAQTLFSHNKIIDIMTRFSEKLIAIALFTFLFLFSSTLVFGQYEKVKFGRISADELTMTTYDKDPDASAIVLFDKGKTTLEYQEGQGFMVVMRRHVRIKILNKKGFDWADFSVPYYESNSGRTQISNIKGLTTYQEKGKTQTAKMG